MEDVIFDKYFNKKKPEENFVNEWGIGLNTFDEKTGEYKKPSFDETQKKYPGIYKAWKEHEEYLDKDGIYPRIMDIRRTLNLKPGQKVNKSIFKNKSIDLPVSDLKHYYDEDTIIDMLNTLAKTNNVKNLNTARYGGLSKYQTAGQTTAKNYYPTSPEDYTKRKQMYNDSLNYYNNSIHDIKLYEDSKDWNFKRGYKKDFPVSIAPNFKYDEQYKPTGFLTYASNKKDDETLSNYPLWEVKSDVIPSSDAGMNTGFTTETDYIPLYKRPTQKVYPYQAQAPIVNKKPVKKTAVKKTNETKPSVVTKSKPASKGQFNMNKLGQKYYIDDEGKETWLTESEYEQKRVPKKALGGWLNKYS